MRPRAARSIGASIALHLGVCALGYVFARRLPMRQVRVTLTEPRAIELVEAPRPPRLEEAAAAQEPSAAASPRSADARATPGRAVAATSRPTPAPVERVPTPTPVESAPSPTPAPERAPAPTLRAMDILRDTRADATGLVQSGAITLDVAPPPRPSRDIVPRPVGTPLDRARIASAGYVRDRLAEAPQRPEAPGVRTYFWHLRRRMVESWRPGIAREPSIGQTLLSQLTMGLADTQRATERAMGAAARPGRVGGAWDALDQAHPGAPTTQPMVGIVDLAQGNTQTTRTEIEVDQSEEGQVLAMRVVGRSRVAGYDDAAMRAVREALPLQTPARMPGGRRSRWSFQTVASRAPFVPGVGMAFDESSGWFEVVYPGRVTLRNRVWLESARPLAM